MAGPSNAARSEFVRYVYRNASPSTEQGRSDLLDSLAETAMGMQLKGKSLTGSSDKGTSAQYAILNQWTPDYTLSLISWTRNFISYATAALAVQALEAAPSDSLVAFRTIVRNPSQ